MPATRDGVYHNLVESTYSISVNGIEYFFSSLLYKQKFKKQLKNNRWKFHWFFNSKDLSLDTDTLADLSLYQMVEKRGFYIKIEGDEATWQDGVKLATQRLRKRRSPSQNE